MAEMTDEEAEKLDIYYTENTIMPVRGKPGTFAQRKEQMLAVGSAVSSGYVIPRSC